MPADWFNGSRPPPVLRIVPVGPEHADALQPLLECAAVTDPTPLPHPYPPTGAREFVLRARALQAIGSQYSFAVCDGDTPIGVTMLKDVDPGTGEAELGYWIGQPYWGSGRATGAARATIEFAFKRLGLRTLRAVCIEANPASLRVLAKLGFTVTDRFRQELPKWAEPRPSVSLRLSREGWELP